MIDIEQMKADIAAGTAGPFDICEEHDWSLDTDGENTYYVIGPHGEAPLAVIAVEQAFGGDPRNDADMRRFCRVPELESAYIALKERADALADVLDSFDVSCNEKSTYKDCYLTFIDPHVMTMRLRNCSSKSFIIADLAKRRKDALAAYRNVEDGQRASKP